MSILCNGLPGFINIPKEQMVIDNGLEYYHMNHKQIEHFYPAKLYINKVDGGLVVLGQEKLN